MQVLDRHVVRLQSRLKGNHPFTSIEGQEACRASTAVGLAAGDLVSDTQKSAAMNLAYGVNHGSLLRHIDAVFSETKDASATVEAAATRQLPWIADSEEQMSLALGAALAFRTLKQPHLVMAYLHRTDLSRKQWSKALKLAGKLELPIVFIVLPAAPDDRMNLCAIARRAGLPGIPAVGRLSHRRRESNDPRLDRDRRARQLSARVSASADATCRRGSSARRPPAP